MAAGATILIKRKAAAFNGGDLAAGELGVDTLNGDLYFSTDGATVTQIDVSAIAGAGDALTSNSLAQFASTTSAQFAGVISDEEGTGAVVFSTSPTIRTPTIADSDGDTIAEFPDSAASSPTNYISITNAGTGSGPSITVGGGDINIPLNISSAGAGNINCDAGTGTFSISANSAEWSGNVLATLQNHLGEFASTTSAQLAGVISDETGSGAVVFGTSPTIATPDLTLKTGTAPTAEGDIEWHSTNNTILVGDGAGTKTFSSDTDISITESQISDLGTTATLNADADVSGNTWVLDEDTMSSDSATKVPTQQSVKAYADGLVEMKPHFKWVYNATTSKADPTDGLFRANNSNPVSTTELYIDDIVGGGADISDCEAFISRWRAGNLLILTSSNLGNQHLFEIEASATDETGYWTVEVNHLAGTTTWDTGTYTFEVINLGGSPVGEVIWFADDAVPDDFLECNGATISRTTYAMLFAVIGTHWGAGDGSTTFGIPDLRGEFIRGWDNSKGTDSGRAFASSQSSANLAHTHSDNYRNNSNQRANGNTSSGRISNNQGGTTGSSGGSESRPRNYALMPCIRYQ